jgi:hypothetical protein
MRTYHKTGVHHNKKCFRCRITAKESVEKGPVATGINHPEHYETYSFYRYGDKKSACPRCHRELELESVMKAMDAYAGKHGEKALRDSVVTVSRPR